MERRRRRRKKPNNSVKVVALEEEEAQQFQSLDLSFLLSSFSCSCVLCCCEESEIKKFSILVFDGW